MKRLVVSLHDLHPGSAQAIAAQRETLRAWGVARRSLLVVPQFHHGIRADEPEFAAEVRKWREEGDELVLHGFTHDRRGQVDRLRTLFWTRLYTNREAEFLDLPPAEARRRLDEGRKLFNEAGFGSERLGFIAPAWLMAPGLRGVLGEMGFRHTSTLTEFIPLGWDPIRSQSLCWSTRAPWRRAASLAWNDSLFKRLGSNELLRISLHPDDLLFPAIAQQIERLVKSALANGFEAVTYGDCATR